MNRTTAATLLAILGVAAYAEDMPQRKPGLWTIVTQPSDAQHQPMSQRVCLDRDTDALLNRMSSGTLQRACAKNETHVTGNRVAMHAVCNLGKSQQTSDALITFSGDSSYRVEVHAKFEPAFMGSTESHSVQEGKWVSACPSGMEPGDMVMTDGRGHEMRTNLRRLMQSSR